MWFPSDSSRWLEQGQLGEREFCGYGTEECCATCEIGREYECVCRPEGRTYRIAIGCYLRRPIRTVAAPGDRSQGRVRHRHGRVAYVLGKAWMVATSSIEEAQHRVSRTAGGMVSGIVHPR